MTRRSGFPGRASGLSIAALLLVVGACGTPRKAERPLPVVESPAKPLVDAFDGLWILTETGTPETSPSRLWWLSSGAWLSARDGIARTVAGTLCETDPWRHRYAKSNPGDTEDGSRPQNVFRLVTRDEWRNAAQEMKFRILAVNPAPDHDPADWSGIYFFHRRKSADSTYYAGLRVDGAAVVKKKLGGTYSTLAYRPVYTKPAGEESDGTRPLPVGRWLELRSDIRDAEDGSVRIRLFLRDPERSTDWVRVASAVDSGRDGPPIRATAPGGIRSDFMDVEFDRYSSRPLQGASVTLTGSRSPGRSTSQR